VPSRGFEIVIARSRDVGVSLEVAFEIRTSHSLTLAELFARFLLVRRAHESFDIRQIRRNRVTARVLSVVPMDVPKVGSETHSIKLVDDGLSRADGLALFMHASDQVVSLRLRQVKSKSFAYVCVVVDITDSVVIVHHLSIVKVIFVTIDISRALDGSPLLPARFEKVCATIVRLTPREVRITSQIALQIRIRDRTVSDSTLMLSNLLEVLLRSVEVFAKSTE
jgi:hypothetical protein